MDFDIVASKPSTEKGTGSGPMPSVGQAGYMSSVDCRRFKHLRLRSMICVYEAQFDFADWLLIERRWANQTVGEAGEMKGIKLISWFWKQSVHLYTPILTLGATYVQYKALLNRPKTRWMKAMRKLNKMSSAELRDLQMRDGFEVIYRKCLQSQPAAIGTSSWTAVPPIYSINLFSDAPSILKYNTTRRSYVIHRSDSGTRISPK